MLFYFIKQIVMPIATMTGLAVFGILLLIIVLLRVFTLTTSTETGSGQQLEQLRMKLSRLDGTIRAQLQATEVRLDGLKKHWLTAGIRSAQ